MSDLSIQVQTRLADLWHRDPEQALAVADDFSVERSLLEQLTAIDTRRAAGADPYVGIPVAELPAPVRLKKHAA